MKLATLKSPSRDGRLIVVSRDGRRYLEAPPATLPSLQHALDDWDRAPAALGELSRQLEDDPTAGSPLDPSDLSAPLPRAYEWIDGSAYLNHVVLARRARGARVPATLRTEPLVYQGGSSTLLGPRDPIDLPDSSYDLDLEAEVCAVLGDVPRGTTAAEAGGRVRLLMLANDVTYRNLVPAELDKGFGFFQSKPSTAFSPFAVTPDELGGAWRDGRVHLDVSSWLNGELLGHPDAGREMHFSFFELIEHIAKTRAFSAGILLGSGTVSNEDPARGVSCLAEKRARELLEGGAARTPFLRAGDRIRIDALSADGVSVFGAIEQEVITT